MSGADNQTKLQFTLGGRILDVDVGLQTTVGGPDGWRFTGEATVRRSLSELIAKLQNSEASGESWFDDGVLPADVSVDSLTFSYQSQPSLFAIRSDIGIEITSGPAFKLAFVFAKISDDLLVDVCTRGSIDLSSVVGSETGIIGQFLGGLHLDRIGVYYASAQIAPIDGSLLKLADGGTLAFAKGPSFSARFGTAQSYTDIALPPPAAEKEAPKEDMPPAARNPASLVGKPEAGAGGAAAQERRPAAVLEETRQDDRSATVPADRRRMVQRQARNPA